MMKKFLFFVFLLAAVTAACCNCFAASAKIKDKAVTTSKGKEIENTLIITVGEKEAEKLKDSISITLNGAEWSGFENSGRIDNNVSYIKSSANSVKLSVALNDNMLKSGYTINVPLKCRITQNLSQITAVVDYGAGYNKATVTFAKCSISRAYLSGSVFEHKKGDQILRGGNKLLFNNLKITVIGDDVERTRKSITVKYNGAVWSDYNKNGTIENSKHVSTSYTKIDESTLSLQINEMPPSIQFSGYTLTLPLSGTVTGSGDISVTVDFGYDDIKPCTVVFARCVEGSITLSSLNENTVVGTYGRMEGVVVNDSTTQSFKKGSKITLSLLQSYHFAVAPKIEGEGKFAGKCKAEINKNNDQQCIITITDAIEAGNSGSMTLTDGIIYKGGSSEPKNTAVEMSLEATGWEKYSSTAKIGTYKSGANPYGPLSIEVKTPGASANMYEQVSDITISDFTGRKYKKGDKITIRFDKDFYFFTQLGAPKMITTGNFRGRVGFEFNNSNRNEAYIVFNSDFDTTEKSGITLSGLVIKRDAGDAFDVVNVSAYISGDECSYCSKQAGKYDAALKGVLSDTKVKNNNNSDDEKTETKSENAPRAVFQIDNVEYSIGGEKKELLSAPYIKDGSTMLPMRAVAGIVGIADDDISFADGTAVFKLADGGELVVAAGEKNFYVGKDVKEAAVAAEIKNGTMFLPMRSLVNALGIDNDCIEYNAESKEIVIK